MTDTTTEPAGALEVARPAAPAMRSMPSPAEWQMINQMSALLASSDLVPAAYRKKPENVVLASLAGRAFGWDPTMSMRSFHVIEGVPSMKPEVMLALVRSAGHSVRGEITGEGPGIVATVTGIRSDTGDEMTFSFSVSDAVTALLCEVKDGRVRARSKQGKILPWETYTKSMCWARALSQLCRMLFPDVVLGAGYTPEEISQPGGWQPAEDDVIDLEEVDGIHVSATPAAPPEGWITIAEAKRRILERCGGDVDCARQDWDEYVGAGPAPGEPDPIHPPAVWEPGFTAWLADTAPFSEGSAVAPDGLPHEPEHHVDAAEDGPVAAQGPAGGPGPDDPVDAEIVAEAPPAPLSGQAADDEALYQQLVRHCEGYTTAQLSGELRRRGGSPVGRKADLVEMLAAAVVPIALASGLDAALADLPAHG